MIWLVRLIQSDQLLIPFQQVCFSKFRRQRAGFLPRRNRLVKPASLRVGRRQGADKNDLLIMRQFTGALASFTASAPFRIPGVRTGGKLPCQVV